MCSRISERLSMQAICKHAQPESASVRASIRSRAAPLVGSLLALGLLSGCIGLEAPKDFLVLKDGTSEYKAVSPDDARIWVREFSDGYGGDLAFWSEVLKNELVENRGYTLLEEGTTKDAGGTEGKLSTFELTAGGAPQRYLLAVFVHEGWLSNTVVAAEFAAEKAVFDKRVAAVKGALATLDP
jgi:hypothetical protein